MAARALPLLIAFLAAVGVAAASADAAVYDRGEDCVNPRATPAALSFAEPGDPVHVLAEPGAVSEAGAVSVKADAVLGRPDRAMATLFSQGLSRTLALPRTVGGGAYRIYVVPSVGGGADAGVVSPSCADVGQTAVLIAQRYARTADTPAFVAHEFAHVLQNAAAGHTLLGSWWLEATAEYAGRVIELPFDDFGRDAAFLARPELPLDSRAGLHEYGAWRFVAWLGVRMGDRRLWPMLRDSFERHATRTADDDDDQPNTTRVVRRALQEAGRDLDADLARFWADHLRPSADGGPAAARTTVRVRAGASTKSYSVRRLAARLLDLAPDAGIRRLRVRVDPPGDDTTYVTGPLRRVRGFDKVYCTEGGRHPRLPDDLAFAYTNANASTQTLRVKLDASTDDSGCRAAGTPTPVDPPDAAACAAKEGTYDTGAGDVRVKLSVDCFRGRLTVEGITGQVPCAGRPVPLGTGVDTYYLLHQEAGEDDHLQTTYSPGSTTSVTLDVRLAGSQASGTVRATAKNLLGETVCTSETESFVARTG